MVRPPPPPSIWGSVINGGEPQSTDNTWAEQSLKVWYRPNVFVEQLAQIGCRHHVHCEDSETAYIDIGIDSCTSISQPSPYPK